MTVAKLSHRLATKYETFEVPIDSVEPSKANPRKTFDEEQLAILQESIERHDIIEPILIRKATSEIIDGERRWRAEKAAGKKTIQVRVYDVDESTASELRLTAQMQRLELTDREKENALYDLWIEGNKTGRYIDQRTKKPSKKAMARAVGINDALLARIILTSEERLRRSSHSDVIQNAKMDDLNVTRQLEKVDPESREELLKQRETDSITHQELREITSIITETPKDHNTKSAKEIVEEFKAIKEEQKAETKEALKRRRFQIEGVEGVLVTKGTKDYEEFNSETRLLDDYKTAYIRIRSSFRADLLKPMKDAGRLEQCVNIVWKTYKICQELLTEMDVDLNE